MGLDFGFCEGKAFERVIGPERISIAFVVEAAVEGGYGGFGPLFEGVGGRRGDRW